MDKLKEVKVKQRNLMKINRELKEKLHHKNGEYDNLLAKEILTIENECDKIIELNAQLKYQLNN